MENVESSPEIEILTTELSNCSGLLLLVAHALYHVIKVNLRKVEKRIIRRKNKKREQGENRKNENNS